MSKVKSYLYYIEYKDGSDDTMNQVMLESVVDNMFDNISKIVKQYRLHGGTKKQYRLTLFTIFHTFSPEQYIEHYRSLNEHVYGANVINDFDIEMITMFN